MPFIIHNLGKAQGIILIVYISQVTKGSLHFMHFRSLRFGESISASKYPTYTKYQSEVSRFIPWFPRRLPIVEGHKTKWNWSQKYIVIQINAWNFEIIHSFKFYMIWIQCNKIWEGVLIIALEIFINISPLHFNVRYFKLMHFNIYICIR